MRVCIAAGGTGGHLLPGLSVGKELKGRGHAVHFIIRTDTAAQAFLARQGFSSTAFYYEGFPRATSPKALFFPFHSATALWNARRALRRQKPAVVLGMGGYISVPVGIAARMSRIPLVVHEQNSRAGMANRLLARWAVSVATSFSPTEGLPSACRPVQTGLPLRPDLKPKDPFEARRSLGLDPDAMTLLVFGGSQGAQSLNRLVTDSISALASRRDKWQFIHITGEKDRVAVEDAYKSGGWRSFVRGYWEDMATLYSSADFVVARSGANTVMELACMGKRALLIPYPFATDNHQELNARFLESQGTASVLLQASLTKDKLRSILESLPPVKDLREENRQRLGSVPDALTQGSLRLAELVERSSR